MGIYDQLQKLNEASPTPKVAPEAKEKRNNESKHITEGNQSTNRPISQPVRRPTEQSTHPFSDIEDLGPVVEKPRAFYITQKVDRWLDDAVRYLQEKGLYKVDRSILMNALIHNAELYKPASLDKLRDTLLAHLTNKSLRRV